jgi:hypothetical protein
MIEHFAFKEERSGLLDQLPPRVGLYCAIRKKKDRTRKGPHAVFQFYHAFDDLRRRRLSLDDGIHLDLTWDGFKHLLNDRRVFIRSGRRFKRKHGNAITH